ncbi:uncharacterized protein Z518_10798 [Rhinocladiella mackenziei CBS 650.93]|uniref:DhaK domain-containing protein n=1 Tax=Rhinocladiella mackenziei CBS 650.93 TaxID=1442369 RepID=A0A0D2I9D2_9EURO|nr:uncharacterized protein Z518_10798 [Rhinocladiella mackenziei CBS 650.93]KIW99870.1 hypothetical protein Z518_10798 [Rhinocladiella mackenziei CBS 650.93]
MDVPMYKFEHSMLELPASYGVSVEDMVMFNLGENDEEKTLDIDSTISSTGSVNSAGAGALLVAKSCDALVNLGYNQHDVRKVGDLVARNLMTCDSALLSMETVPEQDERARQDIGRTVESMLKRLLAENIPRSRTVTVNSNEPVVLINQNQADQRINKVAFNRVMDEVVRQLQQNWNIWPVRVYAGPFVPMGSGNVNGRSNGFSITLLNVVNTDIGGPSMVQLLDAPCDAPEWTCFVRKEARRERDLLYREEQRTSFSEDEEGVPRDDASERSLQSGGAESTDSESSDLAMLKASKGPPAPAQESTSEGPSSDVAFPLPASEDVFGAQSGSPGTATEPKEISLSQDRGLPERRIEHPTWQRHDDSMSLLDLIRSQASMVAPLGKEGRTSGEKESDIGVPPESETVHDPSDDGFEVV